MMIKYVDPNQNVYYFEETRLNHHSYIGVVTRIRPGYYENINSWKVGDEISVVKCVCVREEHIRL
jgi:hypothetical protein